MDCVMTGKNGLQHGQQVMDIRGSVFLLVKLAGVIGARKNNCMSISSMVFCH
jgi:hypothetical protein